MTAAVHYSLTEHTDFRKLEFQYSKSRDENAELRARLLTIEEVYRHSIEDFERQKLEWYKEQAKLKASALDALDKVNDLISFSEGIFQQLKNFQKMGIELGVDLDQKDVEGKIDQVEQTKQIFNSMVKSMMIVLNKNNDLALKYEKDSTLYKQESRQNKRREKELKQEISYLSEEITKFESMNTSLMNELNMLKRENMDYKLQINEMNKATKEQSILDTQNDEHIEDNNFALDLLNYQKELLERIFTKLLSSLKNEAINEIITDIYSSYEAVCEAYRQKLQIQYDLQDLQRQYKREKNTKVSQNLLIELRKQIEDFRKELHKQKQLLYNQQQHLEGHFINLQGVDREENKIRSYTIQIEKKLKDIKSYNETKRNSDDSGQPKSSRIQFKATTKTEDVMKEMVRKDRQNIEKIFKETRLNYRKNIL